MDKLEFIILEALNKYFKTVTAIGYVSNKDTLNILFLLYLRDFIEEFIENITLDDYKLLYKTIECLQGGCFIPNGTLSEYLPVDLFRLQELQRIAENNTIRLDLVGSLREREY